MNAKLKKVLLADRTIVFAYLFGSRAREQERTDSDWDVAVYLNPEPKDGPHGKQYNQLYCQISQALQTNNVDLLILNFAPPLLAHQVLSEGKKFFCRNKAEFVTYFVRLMGQVDDARYMMKPYIAALKKRLSGGRSRGEARTGR